MQRTKNPFDVFDEDRPASPVVARSAMSEHEVRAMRSANRELFLRESGYEILPEGTTKVLKVNRDWIAQGKDQKSQAGGNDARWLLFVDDRPPIAVYEALYLDETQTETEVIQVQEQKQEKYGCGMRTVVTQKEIRSAYMISTGRVAYKLAA